VEEFVDCFISESQTQINSSTPGNTPQPSSTPQPSDDLSEFTQEELSHFIIFLLKSRITILETMLEQMTTYQDSEVSFCTALDKSDMEDDDVVSTTSR